MVFHKLRANKLDPLDNENGINIHRLIFRTPLGQNPGIAEYQVLQTRDGAKIAVVTTEPIDVAALRQELVDGLAKSGLPNAQIEIDFVDSLKRHKETGKLKRFIPMNQGAKRRPNLH